MRFGVMKQTSHVITTRDSAKTPQSPCYPSYQCHYSPDRLLPSFRLLTDQTPAKAAVVDSQRSVG